MPVVSEKDGKSPEKYWSLIRCNFAPPMKAAMGLKVGDASGSVSKQLGIAQPSGGRWDTAKIGEPDPRD